ncbi:putative art-4 protein [Podospora didyma]|uniref:20S-pre-rRNA D-site endonuclease NOB1 n=1 Tax=Podospora didyma TaxID=330526 RepID=A0AAE0K5G8_9PEZI|nr:putative art-4 protein [Podospora didyma]
MEAPTVESITAPVEGDNPAPTTAPSAPNAEPPATGSPAPTTPTKPVHSLVIDANAIIKNDPTVSTLLASAEELYTIPSVVTEIRDEATRSRFQTTLMPFIKLRTPRPESVLFVTNFARRTGDLQVLSKPDIHLLALTYDLEVERNGGDWRLRKEPNQKTINGKPPGAAEEGDKEITAADADAVAEQPEITLETVQQLDGTLEPEPTPKVVEETGDLQQEPEVIAETVEKLDEALLEVKAEATNAEEQATTDEVAEQLEDLALSGQATDDATPESQDEEESESEEDDGAGKWITPSNIKKHQARENTKAPQPIQKMLQAALITGDMAMRNVALRINLNLLDTGLSRVTFLKTWVLRCHGCWKICKDMSKQFCPSCGQPTLTRVSCTTDAAGNFKLHLKKNFQYNNRGNVYSIPKPTHGSASGKISNIKGGGQNAWGSELILAEDQKEYSKKVEEDRRTRYKDLMDEDYLPSILTGARNSGNGRIKVGAGRTVNAKKRN